MGADYSPGLKIREAGLDQKVAGSIRGLAGKRVGGGVNEEDFPFPLHPCPC